MSRDLATLTFVTRTTMTYLTDSASHVSEFFSLMKQVWKDTKRIVCANDDEKEDRYEVPEGEGW